MTAPSRDTTTALPATGFVFSPGTGVDADAVVDRGPAAVYRRLLADQETETSLLLARRVLAAAPLTDDPAGDVTAPALRTEIEAARDDVDSALARLAAYADPTRTAILRERAPLALVAGARLDVVSQPATQPAVVVNALLAHHWAHRGHGAPQRSATVRRRRALEAAGVVLPEVASSAFLDAVTPRPLTLVLAAQELALARLPASSLPELVGTHVARGVLAVDDRLCGAAAVPGADDHLALLEQYLHLVEEGPEGDAVRSRTRRGVRIALHLERAHLAMLEALAAAHAGRTLDEQVAAIVSRHAPFAGTQHRKVRLGGRLLAERLSEPELDVARLLTDLRDSVFLRPDDDGDCRFLRATRFGGPMFGIFDEAEAEVLRRWAASAPGRTDDVVVRPDTVGLDAPTLDRADVPVADDVREEPLEDPDDRELLYRLVTVEHHPHVLPLARARAERGLDDAEVLFDLGRDGRFTDASWFDYSPEALRERVDRIYWDKLVGPYRPLTEIPDRDEVVFVQKTFALGSLVDGAWAHRIGATGREDRPADAMLHAIHADEMGRGDVRKNHITLIRDVLTSMDVELPHLRDPAFREQDELPDLTYGFALHQLCLALFPDSLHDEILGYNLGIEMFGLGEMRSHEIQKLRRHGFDTSYEQAHLSIDNISAGHARQSADIIVTHLDDVARRSGPEAVAARWRRVWRGYASFALFVEDRLTRAAAARAEPTSEPTSEPTTELTI